ncbi:MAG: trimethylamine methyltransferase family protein [Pseudomonadota bacterium]|nr:trimethylamine methyltransferase family protein [Pseudomonadota bacterium]
MRKIAQRTVQETSYAQLDAGGIVSIHETSLAILESTGIKIELQEALDLFRQAGARVEDNVVHITFGLIDKALDSVPAKIVLAAHENKPPLIVEGTQSFTGTGGAALNVLDIETGESRLSTLKDIYDIARLVDRLDNIDFYVRPVVAQDVPREHLDVNKYYAALAGTQKHVMASVYSEESARDIIEMASLMCGGFDNLRDNPVISFITSCCLSPLCMDPETTAIMTELVRNNMPVVIGTAPMAGSTSPVTMAGTLAQMNAELLAGIVYSQLVNPGAPVIYGAVPAIADMHTGGFSGGAVEYGMLNSAAAQMAQFYDIPVYNSAGVTDSRTPDIQAGYEKAFSLMQSVHSGANLIHHAAGMLDSLKTVAYEQYVIDNDIICMARRANRGIIIDEENLARSVIQKVGHGGTYLTQKHTKKNMRQAFIYPRLADKNTPRGEDDEPLDARERARRIARDLLAEEHTDHIPADIDKEIRKRFTILLEERKP